MVICFIICHSVSSTKLPNVLGANRLVAQPRWTQFTPFIVQWHRPVALHVSKLRAIVSSENSDCSADIYGYNGSNIWAFCAEQQILFCRAGS